MKIKELVKGERPRERLIKKGVENLSLTELFAIILGSGSKKDDVLNISHKLLSKYGLDKLSVVGISDLVGVFGIGRAKACKIMACFEIGRRLACQESENIPQIFCAEDVVKLFGPKMSHLSNEQFRVIYLNSRNRILSDKLIFVGSLNCSVVHAREIFENAILEKAASVILLHNHPSGDSESSEEDIAVTKQLISAGEILGISVLDHIIIGKGNFESMKTLGNLFD